MSDERRHLNEYTRTKAKRKFTRYSLETEIDNETKAELFASSAQKLKPVKRVRVTKLSGSSGHAGRIEKRRKIVKEMPVNFIKELKDKVY